MSRLCLVLGAVGVPLVVHAGLLTGGELLVTGIVRVVHVVVDGVDSSTGAGVASGRAARSSSLLGRGVGNRVTNGAAGALEGVLETEPVADLVDNGVPVVVVGLVTAGNGSGQDGATVLNQDGVAADGLGEVAVAESVKAGDEVDVDIRISTLAKRGLHGSLGAILGPVGVDSPVTAGIVEGDAVGGIGRVHDIELFIESSILFPSCQFNTLLLSLRFRPTLR